MHHLFDSALNGRCLLLQVLEERRQRLLNAVHASERCISALGQELKFIVSLVKNQQ